MLTVMPWVAVEKNLFQSPSGDSFMLTSMVFEGFWTNGFNPLAGILLC